MCLEHMKHYMDRSYYNYEKWAQCLGGIGYCGYRTLEGVLTKPLWHKPGEEDAVPVV